MSNNNGKLKTFQLYPIGKVHASDEEQSYYLANR